MRCKAQVDGQDGMGSGAGGREGRGAVRLPMLATDPAAWFILGGLFKLMLITAHWSPFLLSLAVRGAAADGNEP